MANKTVRRGEHRRFVSPWFKRQMFGRLVVFGVVVFAAACFAFGAIGVGIGVAVFTGLVALLGLQRRRRWRASERQMWE